MKKTWRLAVAAALLLGVCAPAVAVEGDQVAVVGGTVQTIPQGSIGTLDFSSTGKLVVRAAGREIGIPYQSLEHVAYRREVARHLGVVPAIAAGLVRKREKKHFLTLTFLDEGGAQQVIVLEIAKNRSQAVLPALLARAPQACGPSGGNCVVHPEH